MDDKTEDDTVTLTIKGVDPSWRYAFQRVTDPFWSGLNRGEELTKALQEYVEKKHGIEQAEHLREQYRIHHAHKWKRKSKSTLSDDVSDDKKDVILGSPSLD